ncbi:MAG: hypothetical protein ACXVJ7_00735 [Acidimicrobiia bacterium]
MRRWMAVVAVFAVFAAACGSSGGSASSGEGKQYVDAIMKKYDEGDSKDVFTRSQAQCLSEGIVDAVGVDKLKAAGVTPSDISSSSDAFKAVGKNLSVAEAKKLVDVMTGGSCFNFTDLVVKSVEKSGSSSFGSLTKTKVRCLFDKLLNNAAFKSAMVDSILGRDTSSDAFSKAFSNQSDTFKIFSQCNIKPSELSGSGN